MYGLLAPVLALSTVLLVILLLFSQNNVDHEENIPMFYDDMGSSAHWREKHGRKKLTKSIESSNYDDANRESLKWTIFITPEDFQGSAARRQRRAIQSWLKLDPRPQIVLAGYGQGYNEVASDFGLKIDRNLDLNFVQMPLAGSLIDLAMSADSEVSVILNSDLILTQSFVEGILKVRSRFESWFLTGARIDIQSIPPMYEPTNPGFNDKSFSEYCLNSGVLHTAGGTDYFVWNNHKSVAGMWTPLVSGHVPPFIRGKSKFDNWLVHEVIEGGYREVIDGSEAIVAVHVDHAYRHADPNVQEKISPAQNHDGQGTSFWQKDKSSNWQIFHNINLALTAGTYRNQQGTTLHAPWKLALCYETTSTMPCILKRLRPGVCPCEHNSFAMHTQNDPKGTQVKTQSGATSTIIRCGTVSHDDIETYKVRALTPQGQTPVFGLPFTLQTLLPIVARNNHVIVTGVSYNYRDMLMNFVCNLRRLKLYDSLIIAVWDEKMYEFGFQMGLPVFLYTSDVSFDMNTDMTYGSKAFKRVTKLKSQVILQILRLGYDVTWTDTDIVWFQNVLPTLAEMRADFVVQSNAPISEEAANGPLRINSGFYRIRSTPQTVEAMEQIVMHSAASTLTEQPSFYMVLCGTRDGLYKAGLRHCEYPGPEDDPFEEPLFVEFLNRTEFPNGAMGDWETVLRNTIGNRKNLYILHNNWIRGMKNKIERLIDQKLWFYDRNKRTCSYASHPNIKLDWAVEADAEE